MMAVAWSALAVAAVGVVTVLAWLLERKARRAYDAALGSELAGLKADLDAAAAAMQDLGDTVQGLNDALASRADPRRVS